MDGLTILLLTHTLKILSAVAVIFIVAETLDRLNIHLRKAHRHKLQDRM